jgi:hypothetical protein
LAIKAEPPELQPGETAAFSALLIDPFDEVAFTVWSACPPQDAGGVDSTCGLNFDLDFDPANLTGNELEESGVIGFEPFLPPTYVPPQDALDGLDEFERREGIQVPVFAAGLSSDLIEGEDNDPEAFDFNQVEVAYKRLVVSEALTPNGNPAIEGFLIDGIVVDPDAVVEVDPGQEYEVGAWLAEGTVEVYQYVDDNGEQEERVEEPYIKWFTDAGTLLEDATLYPFLDATWRAPSVEDDIQEGTWWAVIRDRRGGINWASQKWRVRGGD